MNDEVATLALRMATQALKLIKNVELQHGTNGIDGLKGLDGVNGVDGTDGKDGTNGIDGTTTVLDGVNGMNGIDGTAGTTGPMPQHEVRGNSIRFEVAPETWGNWIELGTTTGGGGGGGTDAMVYAIHTFTAAAVQLKDINSTVLCDCTSNAIVVTLPSAKSLVGRVITVKKVDSTANTATVQGYASNTIDGEACQVITKQWTSLRMQSTGNTWVIM